MAVSIHGFTDYDGRNDLSIDERTDYINSVLCLQKKPSKAVNIPGAKNRYDDFVATHMTLVNMLHSPVTLSLRPPAPPPSAGG
jgi:hypothetical protein